MKKFYSGLDAVKVSFDGGFLATEAIGYSGCDSIVGYHNAGQQCDSPDTEKAVLWTSDGPIIP